MSLYLLDAPVFIWWLTDDECLGETTRQLIADQRNRVALSAATVWEVAQMVAIGMVKGLANIQQIIEDEGFEVIPIDGYHSELAGWMQEGSLVKSFVVAQIQTEGATLITAGKWYVQQPIRIHNAYL